jgi:hypothetical protein
MIAAMYRVNSRFLFRVKRWGHSWHLTLQNLATGQRLDFTSWDALIRYLRALPPTQDEDL